MEPLKDFIDNAKSLSRNPLGIIALFISLIYGFACIVLGTSLINLKEDYERLPLIYFIIIFPIIILIAFIYLVVYHHEKLYAPSDFKDDKTFLEALDKKSIKNKQEEEVKQLEQAEEIKHNEIQDDKELQVDIQEDDNSSEETLLEKYSNSEKWVAKELSLKLNISLRPNIKLSTGDGTYQFDAYGNDSNRTCIVEVKYWEYSKSNKQLFISIQDYLRKYEKLKYVFGRKNELILIIALVFDNLSKINQKEYVDFINKINENIQIEFYQYNHLKNEYS